MPRDLAVSEILTTDALTLRPNMAVEEAARLLDERGVSGAPVTDDNGRLVGLLDSSDLVIAESRLHAPTTIELFGAYLPLPGERQRFEEEVRHALGRTVADLMHLDPPRLSATSTIEDAATIMVEQGINRVPVTDEHGVVTGVVSRANLIAALARS